MDRDLVRPDLRNYCPASNLALNEKIKIRRKEGNKIYHLGFGQAPFPIPDIAVQALREYAWDNAYHPVSGIPELREAVCKFHSRHDDLHFKPEHVIVGPGSKELVFLILEVFNGDVILKSPSWTTYKPQCLLSRHTVHIVDSSLETGWKLTPQALEQVVSQQNPSTNKLLIFCNPDNPTGVSYSAAELESISVVLRKYNILVISDEIYGRVHFSEEHLSLAKYYPEGTIVSSGLSKWASAGGWRLGYHLFPAELNELYSAVKSAGSHTYSCAPGPVQHAAVKLLNNYDTSQDYVKHTNRIYKYVCDYVFRELTSIGVKVEKPEGSFYMFPDFGVIKEQLKSRNITTCDEMCAALMDEASVVLMAGGPAFLRPVDELTTRLCFVDFDGKIALDESRKIGLGTPLPDTFMTEWCPQMYEGVQALKNWVVDQSNRGPDPVNDSS